MSVVIPRGPQPASDEGVRAFAEAIGQFVADHPGACAEVYRHAQYSVRIRVVWGGFQTIAKSGRRKLLWPYLESLPAHVLSDVALTILATPQECHAGVFGDEFDNPASARADGADVVAVS